MKADEYRTFMEIAYRVEKARAFYAPDEYDEIKYGLLFFLWPPLFVSRMAGSRGPPSPAGTPRHMRMEAFPKSVMTHIHSPLDGERRT